MSTATKRQPITERQREIYDFVVKFRRESGYCCSLQELCDAFGYGSKNAVMAHLNPLRRRGWLTWNDGEARTLRPTSEGDV